MNLQIVLHRWGAASSLFVTLAILNVNTATVLSQFMLSPTAVVGTDLGVFDPITPLTNMINQSGIDTPFVSGSTDFDTFFSVRENTFAQANGSNNWQSDYTFELPLTGYVDFDLGDSYRIDKIAIWNLSIKDVTLKLYEDLAGPEQIIGSFTLTNHLNFPFSYTPDVITFGTNYQGRYLRFAIASAYTYSFGDPFAYAIIGEVVLSATQIGGLPPLSIVRAPNGDITVTFTEKLQAAPSIDGTFADIPGNPQGTHTLPQASLLLQQYFRASD